MEDEIYPSAEQIAWAADNRTIFYTKVVLGIVNHKIDSSGRISSVWRHVLAENSCDGSDDEQIFGNYSLFWLIW